MSNFKCDKCGTNILEGEDGWYVTGCQHFPLIKTSVEVAPLDIGRHRPVIELEFKCPGQLLPVLRSKRAKWADNKKAREEMIIGKTFDFEASHQLPDEPVYGKCRNLHGHRYELAIEISGLINNKGWVMDFANLKKIVQERVIDKYDHQHLNNFFVIPTAEIILEQIVTDIKSALPDGLKLHAATLHETARSFAKYVNK